MTGGTLRSRMCDTPAEGNAHAKTGSLTGASALSGYVTDPDGRELIYSIILNNYLADSVKGIEDSIVVTLAESGEGRTEAGAGAGVRPVPRGATADAGGLECSWQKPKFC